MSTNQRLVMYLRVVKGERVTAERAAGTEPSVRLEPTTTDVRGISCASGRHQTRFCSFRANVLPVSLALPVPNQFFGVSRSCFDEQRLSRDPPVRSHPLHPASLSQDYRNSPRSRPLSITVLILFKFVLFNESRPYSMSPSSV